MYNKETKEGRQVMNNKKKILIADDETVNLDFFELMLSKLGFVVEKSNNGLDVLEKVKKFHPDLIILDNIMSGMSGREITKNLRNDPNFKNISIIMLSALDDVKDKVAGFEAGVDDYITKPFNFTEVLARINAVLRNRALFDQIKVREARLALAEELNRDLKENLSAFVGNIDELDRTIAMILENAAANKENLTNENLKKIVKPVGERMLSVRKQIAILDARIEKTINEWNNLKKDEIGLSILESQIRKLVHQEQ